MKVNTITVSAGRTFNHPFETYSNLRPHVTVTATLDEGENWEEVTKQLQAKAESIVEDHKTHMLKSLEELHQLTERQRELSSLESGLRRAQSRIDEIRRDTPQLALMAENTSPNVHSTFDAY